MPSLLDSRQRSHQSFHRRRDLLVSKGHILYDEFSIVVNRLLLVFSRFIVEMNDSIRRSLSLCLYVGNAPVWKHHSTSWLWDCILVERMVKLIAMMEETQTEILALANDLALVILQEIEDNLRKCIRP